MPKGMSMIIDCHYHLDPRIETTDDLINQMDENGISKNIFDGLRKMFTKKFLAQTLPNW